MYGIIENTLIQNWGFTVIFYIIWQLNQPYNWAPKLDKLLLNMQLSPINYNIGLIIANCENTDGQDLSMYIKI
jgi:hypothetical protein